MAEGGDLGAGDLGMTVRSTAVSQPISDVVYEQIFHGQFGAMTRLAAMLGADDPEDVAQEAFVRLHSRRRTLRDPHAAVGYLRATVVNLSRSRLRHLSVVRRNRPVPPEKVAEIKQNYAKIWENVYTSMTGFGFTESKIPTFSVSAAEREATYERAWQQGGGFNYMFGTFNDIAVDPAANEAAASFIRRKIAETVKDLKLPANLPRPISTPAVRCAPNFIAANHS